MLKKKSYVFNIAWRQKQLKYNCIQTLIQNWIQTPLIFKIQLQLI